MKIEQGNVLESLRAVQNFLDAHADKLPTLVNSGARNRLDIRVAELGGHATVQSGSHLVSKGATQKHYAMRKALMHVHMAPISRIALADLPRTPELAALKMPRGTPNTEVLYNAAIAMADAAEPFATVFTDAALPADFIAQLRTAAQAMLVPVDTRKTSRSVRSGATKGVNSAMLDARKSVRILDSIVRPLLVDDPALLASWESVKRVPRRSTRTTPAAVPAPAPASSTPQVSTTV